MSNPKKEIKTVKIKEGELANMIDGIVNEAVAVKKKEWLAEQANKGDKTALLETKLNDLEAKFNALNEVIKVTPAKKEEVKK